MNQAHDVIVGYNVKVGFDTTAALNLILGQSKTKYIKQKAFHYTVDVSMTSPIIQIAKDKKLFEALLEPVYQSRTVLITHGEKYGRTKSQVTLVGTNECEVGGYRVTKKGLKKIIQPVALDGFVCVPTYFTIGCEEQYKNVSREDIEKVIDAMI